MKSEFMAAIRQIASERGIKPEDIMSTLEKAMIAAYRKDYPLADEEVESVTVTIDPESGEVALSKDGDDITPPGFGRIAAQTAKQVILQGVREAEKNAALEEFQEKIGRVVPGMLQRFERGSWLVDVGRTIAVMPREEQVFAESYQNNQRLKVYVKKIVERENHHDIIVSRSDADLVRALFELEVPEIQSKAVVIKNIAREPGSRTKIAVMSVQDGVDPVGSMVGQRGVRVQAVTNELNGEKMDIILWSDVVTKFIINALSPAHVSDVIIDDEKRAAQVEVPDDQLSLAIGKEGQNVRLASKLTGYKIDIVSNNGEVFSGKEEKQTQENQELHEVVA
ncbi:transcription termination factor NusA [candidate division WWE3 bacterium]|nr:transcription termination factor NusA [candidate division WWE3 bacterium]